MGSSKSISMASASAVLVIALTGTILQSHIGNSAKANDQPGDPQSTVLAPASVETSLPVGQPISIQPSTGLVFIPSDPPQGDAGFLDAAQAWAKWENGATFDSSFAAPQFGAVTQLTAPAGTDGAEVSYANQAVWAYRQIQCLEPMGTVASSTPAASSSQPTDLPSNQFGPCITWTFLDARTGQGVLVTQQTVG